MKIAMVHNCYAVRSGEEVMIDRIARLLRDHGHRVVRFVRNSGDIGTSLTAQVRAFFSGIYSRSARHDFRRFLREHKPDLIQVQNVYPLISPSILLEARDQGVPIVMRCANLRLICPTGLCYTAGQPCQRCMTGREWWCVLKNCQGTWPRSIGYALRHAVARWRRWFQNTVDVYIAQTDFQKDLLVQGGYDPERIHVIPNMIEPHPPAPDGGRYVAYAGRISHEKGVRTLLAAARRLDPVPVHIAGPCNAPERWFAQAPPNVTYRGPLPRTELDTFYAAARMVVVPSTCYEGFPSVILEAMAHGKPVICSRIGGLPQIVLDEQTGLCFTPGDADQLADCIRRLWNQPRLARRMGLQGYARIRRCYSPQAYLERLLNAYRHAITRAVGPTTETGSHRAHFPQVNVPPDPPGHCASHPREAPVSIT